MYESFGAVVDGDAVEFRLFVPDAAIDASQYERGGPARIAEVRVVGDFQDRRWDSASAPALPPGEHPAGRLFTHRVRGLAEGFYEYKYLVDFENGASRWCTDPCTRYVGRANENAGFVIGGQRLAVRPLADPRPQEELMIYELMLDDFTHAFRGERAPVDAVLDRLDHLLAVGVNTVQLMPWTAWRGGAFSWGYDPFLFFAVEDHYIADPAQPSDRVVRLKRLVDTLHERGCGGDHGRRLQPRERRCYAGRRFPVSLALAGSGGLAVHRRVRARRLLRRSRLHERLHTAVRRRRVPVLA